MDSRNSKVENRPGRKPGTPKTGGRKAGTPNKAQKRWADILTDNGFCIPTQAMAMFQNKNTPPNIKLQILQFLAQYTAAAVKAKDEEEQPTTQDDSKPTDILSIVEHS